MVDTRKLVAVACATTLLTSGIPTLAHAAQTPVAVVQQDTSVAAQSNSLRLTSSNPTLQNTFQWAVQKTNQFVMTGKTGLVNKDENRPNGTGSASYMPSYWAGYYDRTAFYGRDFAHQAAGAQLVGLRDENFNMFKTFAKNATENRKWYTLWAFNFDGSPHTIDYRNDERFVREVPAQFELVEKAYEQYLWTGDRRYIEDPDLWNFYTKVMTDFVKLHDRNGNGIAEGTAKGIFSGACSYNERSSEPIIEAGDSFGAQYQATLAYAGMLRARGETKAAANWEKKAADMKAYFNQNWSVVDGNPNGQYARALDQNNFKKYTGFGKENSWFMPMKLLTEPGPRNDAYLDFISENLANGIGTGPNAPQNIEAYTYIPETYFPYHRNDEAWKWMKYIASIKDQPHERPSQGKNGDYPEISFTWVSHTIEGLMGIEPNAAEHTVITTSHLPKEIAWSDLDGVQMGNHLIDLRHEGQKKSTLTNHAKDDLQWEARFYGNHSYIFVNGVAVPAQQKQVNGVTVSCVTIPVKAQTSVTAQV